MWQEMMVQSGMAVVVMVVVVVVVVIVVALLLLVRKMTTLVVALGEEAKRCRPCAEVAAARCGPFLGAFFLHH